MSKYVGRIITDQAPAGYSVYFDGTGDQIYAPQSTSFDLGAGDWTMEAWIYPTGVDYGSAGFQRIFSKQDVNYYFFRLASGTGYLAFGISTGSFGISSSVAPARFAWSHVAAVRSGNTITLYLNGVSVASGSYSSTPTADNAVMSISGYNISGSTSELFTGYISNARFVKGTALYTAAFTPPTQLLNVTNTSLLTCNSPAIVDQSSNAFAITTNGNAAVSTFTPFAAYNPYNPALGASTPGVWTLDEAMQARATRQWNMYDPYFQNTTLLLHGNGTNGAQNNTFLDSSSNNFTITRNGNTTQGTFSPYGSNWSNYFDGTGDYLSLGGQTAFAFGTGDFTIEYWYYSSNSGVQHVTYDSRPISVNGAYMATGKTSGNVMFTYVNSAVQILGTTVISANTWYHIAISRSGTTTRLFVNGIQDGSATDTTNYLNGSSRPAIGIDGIDGTSTPVLGYISNLRVVKGTAVYTAAFTPPTAPLTAITNTSLLTCQSNRFIDNSTNAFTITRNGDVSVQAFSPFYPTAAYTPQTIGGSGYFDGTGDYLRIADAAALEVGSNNMTVELWIYPTAFASGGGTLFSKWDSSASLGRNFSIIMESNGTLTPYINTTGGLTYTTTTATIRLNAWNHVALVKNGTTYITYINGVSVQNITHTGSFVDVNVPFGIGADGGTSPSFVIGSCFISSFRFLNGTALYTAAFTPPTSPVTAITNTSLLLNFTNAGIVDSTAKNVLETAGNAQISTTQSKFGGSSMYFDGTGDYISGLNTATTTPLGTEDWTIEFWVYPTIVDTGFRAIYVNGYPIQIYSRSSTIETYISSSGSGPSYIVTALTGPASSITVNTWAHVAFVKSGANYRVYVNGVGGSTATSSTAIPLPSNASYAIGATFQFGSVLYEFAGYVDDFRITKGVARYTTNFTPQTSQWQDQ